jgi:hypothetical protein
MKFVHAYQIVGKFGLNLKEAFKNGVYHFLRLGLDFHLI